MKIKFNQEYAALRKSNQLSRLMAEINMVSWMMEVEMLVTQGDREIFGVQDIDSKYLEVIISNDRNYYNNPI